MRRLLALLRANVALHQSLVKILLRRQGAAVLSELSVTVLVKQYGATAFLVEPLQRDIREEWLVFAPFVGVDLLGVQADSFLRELAGPSFLAVLSFELAHPLPFIDMPPTTILSGTNDSGLARVTASGRCSECTPRNARGAVMRRRRRNHQQIWRDRRVPMVMHVALAPFLLGCIPTVLSFRQRSPLCGQQVNDSRFEKLRFLLLIRDGSRLHELTRARRQHHRCRPASEQLLLGGNLLIH